MIDLKFIVNSLVQPSQYKSMPSLGLRQVVSGAATTIVDLVVFQAALWLALPIWVAATNSFICAVLINFCITRFYVFGETKRQRKPVRIQAILYIIASLVSLAIIQVVLYVFAVRLGWPPLPVKIMAIPVVFGWTLFAGKYLVFNKQ